MLIFGIFAMVMVGAGWTVFGYIMGKAPKLGIDVTGLMFIFTGIEFLLSLIAAFCTGIPRVSPAGWGICCGLLVACGIVNYFQLDVLSRAMQKGPNGIIWTITQSGFVFPFAVGIIFFGVPLENIRIAGFVCIIISLCVFGLCGDNNKSSGKWKFLAIAAFLITGLSQVLSNLPSYFKEAEKITPMWRTAAFALGMIGGCIIVRMRKLPELFVTIRKQLGEKEVWKMAAWGSLTNLLTSIFFLYPGMDALAKVGHGAIAYPVMVCSCLIVFELYAIIVLREKRSLLQIGALLLCIAGAAGICFNS
ncbi:MAG: hypothetical protein E7058_02900 [Lentisphaerae bacterium]|nr:hypothetical protein [Lentisphaerota bacterium]